MTLWDNGHCPEYQLDYVNLLGIQLCLTNRFHVAVRLFSNRSQMTSKCGKNKKVAHEAQPSESLMFLPHFDSFDFILVPKFLCLTSPPMRHHSFFTN